MRSVIIMIFGLLFIGCGDDACQHDNDVVAQPVDIEVGRLEERLFSSKSVEEIESFLDANQSVADIFLDAQQYPSNTILAEKLMTLVQNPGMDTLYQEASAEFASINEMVTELELAFGKLQAIYPETKTPRLETIVTGLYKDIYITDTLIVVGLDFFIGDEATYKPQQIPYYILSRYDKEHLSSIIVKYLSGQLVLPGKKPTLLSEMIDFGKTYYLAQRLLPCTPDSILLGYTPQDMELINDNEAVIWATLLENQILYETSHITKRKFLGERPNIYEINQKCPGRVGAWVGWQIVNSYMEKNDVDINSLLMETDNEKIFMQSGYKPQSR
ncbi:gliding motility lipoprotein GldB [Marinoscillum sp.]|uniref:gliding motility lipoprotein GldB n=1 Tax=Marinoscillum sp. TaxID=2024838 RepID=UPI003BA9318D